MKGLAKGRETKGLQMAMVWLVRVSGLAAPTMHADQDQFIFSGEEVPLKSDPRRSSAPMCRDGSQRMHGTVSRPAMLQTWNSTMSYCNPCAC
jgi:hypothetical protein